MADAKAYVGLKLKEVLDKLGVQEWAKGCGAVRAVSSEEATDLVEVNPSGSLVVCWDPLDGSSIVDCNWSVASIFGIWQTGQNGLEWKGADTLIEATGGLGPDVYQLFVKGHGIFCNPASGGAPAKLRVLYEVAPIALLVEAAGGCSSSGKGSALDVAVKTMDQRTPFCCGSEEEVRKVEKALRS
ncbi:hypothetical protein ACSSS7_006280 [Eimeria intestinalis]